MGQDGGNATAPEAHAVHGGDPQALVERITRDKCYASTFWKERCFGVSAAAVVDLFKITMLPVVGMAAITVHLVVVVLVKIGIPHLVVLALRDKVTLAVQEPWCITALTMAITIG